MSGVAFRIRRIKRRCRKAVQYAVMRNLVPVNQRERQLSQDGVRILANSMPKAGTNLLSRLLREMPSVVARWTYHVDETLPHQERQLRSGRKGQVLTAHFPWSKDTAELLRNLDYRTIMMVRDPRDIAVSNVHYATRMDRSHLLHTTLASLPDDAARLQLLLEPPADVMARLPDVWSNNGHRTFLPWLDEPDCLLVRFEDLVGAGGGGNPDVQYETILKISKHIGSDLCRDEIIKISNELFGAKTRTFRKGQIGAWKDVFSERHKEIFKEQSGEALIKLGYETSMDW